jgi:L-aspartate oxidase
MLTVARVLIGAALRREESRGVHWRSDFPRQDDQRWAVRLGDRREA